MRSCMTIAPVRRRSIFGFTEMEEVVRGGLQEDLDAVGDVTTLATITADATCEAHFLVKAHGVVAGFDAVRCVFHSLDATMVLEWTVEEGSFVHAGTEIGKIIGSARAVLSGERLALNILQRMSGIATLTRQMVDRIAEHCGSSVLLDTRKTAPCNRVLDKRAVEIGGGRNHRIGLFDQVMIKDNHVSAAGGITAAVAAVHRYLDANPSLKPMVIVVEARTLDEVHEVIALKGGITRVLLDNMARVNPQTNELDLTMLIEAVALTSTANLSSEASGNVTIDTIGPISTTGVDFISSGALTHSVNALDISLKIRTLQ